MKIIIWLTLLASLTVKADDIEIYQGQQAGAVPNIMLVMDTSRSMSRYVPTSRYGYRYDPAIRYPVPIGGYDPDKIYYSRATLEFFNGDGSTREEVKVIKQNTAPNSALRCDQAWNDIRRIGYYSGKLMHWIRGEGWGGPTAFGAAYRIDNKNVEIVDCKDGGRYDSPFGGTYDYMQRNRWSDGENHPYTNSYSKRIRSTAKINDPDWFSDFYNRAFSGNYLNYHLIAKNDDGSNHKISRMVMAREAIREGLFDLRKRDENGVVDTSAPEKNFNVGLARFDTSSLTRGYVGNAEGGYIDVAVAAVKDNRDTLINKLESYFPWGRTPLTETFFETYQYMVGGPVGYGQKAYYRIPIGQPIRYPTGLVSIFSGGDYREASSTAASRSGNTYTAPTTQSCTQSSIILFSDGAPWDDTNANAKIRTLIQNVNFPPGYSKNCGSNASGDPRDGGCADELAYYLANYDQYGDESDGIQTISTHVIGAFLDQGNDPNDASEPDVSTASGLLRKIALAGNGKYYPVENFENIRDAFNSIVDYTQEVNSSLTSATVAVNSFNRLEASDQVYFSMFQPSKESNWCGNLKRYKFDSSKGILDAKDKPAVDDSTGTFKAGAHSVWTEGTDPDGNEVKLGGMASRLDGARKIYTNLTGNSLSEVDNSLDEQYLYPTGNDADYLNELRNWIAGKNADGSVRKELEDPLHSQPVVINYKSGESVAFIGTNSGYLHAFDTKESDPKELFAFIPKELLHNPNKYLSPELGQKVYGLDGPISYWHDDKNLNGIVDGSDQMVLYVGMRRGGNSYYALDVTKTSSPKLLWKIHGAYPGTALNKPSITSGFDKLGQSWSKLIPAEVKWDGKRRVVLFFGGGYDLDEDSEQNDRIKHSLGTTIYMVDALTGELLWDAEEDATLQAGHKMESSFTADLSLIDRNADGFVDMFYAASIGGQIWRFDIDTAATDADSFAKGGIIADIHGGSGTGNRRIYNQPDISYFGNNGDNFILIALGSGYRAHPLSRSETDYFFLIKDQNALSTPTEYETTRFDDLGEWGDGPSRKGWHYKLPRSAEKVMNPSVTVKGKVLFSAYKPKNALDPNTGTACQPDIGTSKLYTLDVHSDGTKDATIDIPEIPGMPPVQIPPENQKKKGNTDNDDGTPKGKNAYCQRSGTQTLVGLVSIEQEKDPVCDVVIKRYWREMPNAPKQTDDSEDENDDENSEK